MTFRSFVIALSVVACWVGEASAQERRVPNLNELRLSYAPVVQRVAPAVVNVYAAKVVQQAQSAVRGSHLPPLLRRSRRP